MTIQNEQSAVFFQGNGATTEFPFSFLIPEGALEVFILEGITETPVSSSLYSATGLGNPAGGTVTYPLSGALLSSSQSIIIRRRLPYTQLINIENQQRFFASVFTTALDRATMQIQQIKDITNRAVLAPVNQNSAEFTSSIFQAAAQTGEDRTAASTSAALSQTWAESPTPPDPDDAASKSSKTWAGEAEAFSELSRQNANDSPAYASEADLPTVTTADNGKWARVLTNAGVQAWLVVSGVWAFQVWLEGPTFDTVQQLLDSTAATLGPVGQIVEAGGFQYEVVASDGDVITAGGVNLRHPLGPYVILISGQSNAAGAYPDGYDEGPNLASPLVRTWDNVTAAFGSSDRTALPWTRTNPHGNGGKNNYALARAHRIADETGRPVVIVFYATGGRDIESWADPDSITDMWTGMKAATEAALAACGRTEIDELIWAQGEANFEDEDTVFLPKLTTLFTRFRAETWFTEQTPTYFMGPSELHNRYQWRQAASIFCSRVDNRVVFVPANLPRSTQYQITGAGDYTHILGWALWQQGYFAISEAARVEVADTIFYERATGPWRIGSTIALMSTPSLTNLGCWTAGTGSQPTTDFNSANSIAWGLNSKTFGNTSFAFGSACQTASGASFTFVTGDNVTATASGGRSFASGRDNVASALYTFAAGRGHTPSDPHGAAVGSYSRYVTAQDDPIRFQVGNGTSAGVRKNALTARASGAVEIAVPSTAPDPTQNEEIVFKRVSNTVVQLAMRGADGVVRRVDLTLA